MNNVLIIAEILVNMRNDIGDYFATSADPLRHVSIEIYGNIYGLFEFAIRSNGRYLPNNIKLAQYTYRIYYATLLQYILWEFVI